MLVSLQIALKSALDIHIAELKTLMERALQLLTPTPRTFETLQVGSTSQGWMRFVQILPTSVRLPSRSQVEKTGFIEVDLAGIPT